MLEIKNYNNNILKDISFKISDNLCILGSNGVGKTTLAKILTNINTNKNVYINDIQIDKISNDDRIKLINYIPTKLEVYDEHIDVNEYLLLSHFDYNISIDEVLNILNISYLKKYIVKDLSSGEASLVLLASAILHNAHYTILDEPTANLDPNKIKLVYTILKDTKYLKTKVLITHNLNLAYKLGFDILYLKDKSISFFGTNEEFFDERNLKIFFDDNVKKIDNNIVVSL